MQVYDERQIRAVVDAARRLRGGVLCHGHGDEGIRDSVLAGVRSVEHGTFASAATLDLMRARGTYPRPDAVGRRRPRRGRRGVHRPAARRARARDARGRCAPRSRPPTRAASRSSRAPTPPTRPASQSTIVGRGPAARPSSGSPNLDALRAATTTGAALVAPQRRARAGWRRATRPTRSSSPRTRSATSPRSPPSASSSRAAGSRTRRPERCS